MSSFVKSSFNRTKSLFLISDLLYLNLLMPLISLVKNSFSNLLILIPLFFTYPGKLHLKYSVTIYKEILNRINLKTKTP